LIDTFDATLGTVRRNRRLVLGGVAEGSVVTMLGVPAVPVCE
jgi:hypothetical protein